VIRGQVHRGGSHVAPDVSVSARIRTVALGARPKKHLLALAHDLIRRRLWVLHLSSLQWNGNVFSRIGETGLSLGRRFVRWATLKQSAQRCTDHAKYQLVFWRYAAMTDASPANPRPTRRFRHKLRHGALLHKERVLSPIQLASPIGSF
jgi:hypothetical protein